MRLQRIDHMEQHILENKMVTLEDLCTLFNASKNTVRRDVEVLVGRGTVKKVYGGVRAAGRRELSPFAEREVRNLSAKRAVGRRAAALVEDGDVIFIDSGTTTLHMLDGLGERKNLTILTHSLDVIFGAVPCDNLEVISLSGRLERATRSFVGQTAADALSSYNIAKAFMASTGISLHNGVTNASPHEYAIKRAAIERSRRVILLIEQSKYDVSALMSYCGLEKIDTLITDAPPPQSYLDFFEETGGRILLAGDSD